MKIFITGSTGFIGSNLANKLMLAHKVICHGKKGDNVESRTDFYKVDIDSKSNWLVCLSGVNTIVHLAGVAHNNSSEQDYINEVNVKGTINLAKQAAKSGVKRFIFMSSIGVLGNSTIRPFDENSIPTPHSQYAKSKILAEKELIQIARQTGLEVVIIRPVLVYGNEAPGNFGKLVSLVNKVPMLPFALCENKRSFISVDNLVDFISVCITHPKAANEVFCISDGTDVSIREFTDGIAKGLNKKLIQLPIPVSILKLLGKITGKSDMFEQLIGDLQVDSTKAKKLLDWTPPVTMAETFSKLTINK
ncbi:Cholesterol dehydrogenase [Shewanella putrefaciens]|uniref:NAD-dependent epimerase/dehydratase family protein n=1 Tax=Shewanella putrefaciens TaxID=24 RepID=UPI000DFAD92C|nr:NAD-dependent epimerase/dehydratase family protein [Shewanella putrefaciens]SUJ07137.1 Cholesterol dehydrogenase [Shewanella putrefaciens]